MAHKRHPLASAGPTPCVVHTSSILCSSISDLRFEWDPAKAAVNLRKHGVAFEEAETVFSDEWALLIDNPDHSTGEERFVLLGLSAALRVLLVVHCYRAQDDVIRIISARRATKPERARYVPRWLP